MKTTKRVEHCTVEIFQRGVALNTPRGNHKGNPIPPARGQIKGWSKASRQRMREFMLTHEAHGVWFIGTTFTIPGPVVHVDTMRRLWGSWKRRAQERGWASIWRMEVQQRQQVHWHCLLMIPVNDPECGGAQGKARLRAIESWHDALDSLGPRTFDPPYKNICGQTYTHVKSLMELTGAFWYSADCKVEGGTGAWRRYLQDHASKAKQEQIAEGFGRHWGVIGRDQFCEILPNDVVELSNTQYYRFLRKYQRMCTPRIKDSRAAFGSRLGWRIRRGSVGRSVWFSEPAAVRRLVEWAQSEASSVAPARPPDWEPPWEYDFPAP